MSEGLEDLVYGVNNIHHTKIKINELSQNEESKTKSKEINDNLTKEAYIAEDLDNIKNINSRLFSNATCVSEPNLHKVKPFKVNQKLEKYYNELFKSESKGAFHNNNDLLIHKKVNNIFKDVKLPQKNSVNLSNIGNSNKCDLKLNKVVSCSPNPLVKTKKESIYERIVFPNNNKKHNRQFLTSFQVELNNINNDSKKRNFVDSLTATSTLKSNLVSPGNIKDQSSKLDEKFIFTSVKSPKKHASKLTWWEKGNSSLAYEKNPEFKKNKNQKLISFDMGLSVNLNKTCGIKSKATHNSSSTQTRMFQSKLLKL